MYIIVLAVTWKLVETKFVVPSGEKEMDIYEYLRGEIEPLRKDKYICPYTKVVPIFVVARLVKYCVRRIVEASGGAITEAEAKKSIKGILLGAMEEWRKEGE